MTMPGSRRRFLTTLAAGMGVVACRTSLGQPAEGAAYVGVETSAATGLSTVGFFGATGARQGATALDFRAHGLACDGRHVVVFPRRPGNRFAVVDRGTLEILAVVGAPDGRHFYGHGAFTRDGRTLLVTENDLESLSGWIGLYEIAPRPRRVGQLELPGPGPHEIARDPRRDLFYIALGGLQTHPAYGRTPLNLTEFRSQILLWDAARGILTPLGFWSGTEGVSLRHAAMDDLGRLYVGGQVEDTARAETSHVIWVVDKGEVQSVPDGGGLRGYVSSVAARGRGAILTSKEGGLALRLEGNTVLDRVALDGAGAAALGPGLTALSGYQELRLNSVGLAARGGHEFDNHGLALS